MAEPGFAAKNLRCERRSLVDFALVKRHVWDQGCSKPCILWMLGCVLAIKVFGMFVVPLGVRRCRPGLSERGGDAGHDWATGFWAVPGSERIVNRVAKYRGRLIIDMSFPVFLNLERIRLVRISKELIALCRVEEHPNALLSRRQTHSVIAGLGKRSRRGQKFYQAGVCLSVLRGTEKDAAWS